MSYLTSHFERNLKFYGGYALTCFTAGTQVSMADGSYKNIEDIKVGDEVKTHNGINVVTNL